MPLRNAFFPQPPIPLLFPKKTESYVYKTHQSVMTNDDYRNRHHRSHTRKP